MKPTNKELFLYIFFILISPFAVITYAFVAYVTIALAYFL